MKASRPDGLELNVRIFPIVLTVAAVLVPSLASAQEVCGRPAETVATVQSSSDGLRGGDLKGRSAFICGNAFAASDILEKAVTERPTVRARFNLAAAYARTGRFEAAADLYRTVVADGQFTVMTLDTLVGEDGPAPIRFNATDEAAVRLVDMEFRIAADQSTAAIGDANEDATKTAVQAIVDRAHVPSDRALVFDGLVAEPEVAPLTATSQ